MHADANGRSMQHPNHDAALREIKYSTYRQWVADAVARVGRISAELDKRLADE